MIQQQLNDGEAEEITYAYDETGPAKEQITFPEQIAPPDYTTTLFAGFIAVIIAVAIATVLLYRKK